MRSLDNAVRCYDTALETYLTDADTRHNKGVHLGKPGKIGGSAGMPDNALERKLIDTEVLFNKGGGVPDPKKSLREAIGCLALTVKMIRLQNKEHQVIVS